MQDQQLITSYKDAQEYENCFHIFVARIHWCGQSNSGEHEQPFLSMMPVILYGRVLDFLSPNPPTKTKNKIDEKFDYIKWQIEMV